MVQYSCILGFPTHPAIQYLVNLRGRDPFKMAAFGKRFLLICGLAKTSGTMFRSIRLTLTATFAVIGLLATASGESGEEQFGPSIALTRNAEIVRDVKIAENGRIYLILNPAHKEKEIILKNSIFSNRATRIGLMASKSLSLQPIKARRQTNIRTEWKRRGIKSNIVSAGHSCFI
jgi:hypothetical protein